MLRDEVARAWVEAARPEAAHDEVDEGAGAATRAHEHEVEEKLSEEVEEMPAGERLGSHEAGAERVEEDLEGAVRGGSVARKTEGRGDARKEGFAEDIVEAEELEARWEVRVDSVLAHVFMVLYVISLHIPSATDK